jgi:hypothetical protein
VANETTRAFGEALRDLLVEQDYATRSGNPNWRAFAAELEDIHYETLRKAVTGERAPSPRLLEECARVLRIKPGYFAEYRLYEARRNFDPREVGFERALQNLMIWANTQP